MKILHVHGEYVSFGGAETYLRDVMQAQRAAGHEVNVVYSSDVPPGYAPKDHEIFLPPSYGVKSGLRALPHFRRLLKRLDPDVLHLHVTHYHISPLVLAYLIAQKPSVQTVQDTLAFCFKEPNASQLADWARILPDHSACYLPVGRACFRTGCATTFLSNSRLFSALARIPAVLWRRAIHQRIGHFLANSEFTRADLIRNGFRTDRIDVVYMNLAIPDAWRAENDHVASDEPPLILYAGKISAIKGVPRLVEALALLAREKWQAILAGTGPDMAEVRSKIVSAGLEGRVRILDSVSHEQLGAYYRRASIVVFPSIWPEPFGLVGIEAMYFAKPVVGFNVGGVSEWLKDQETGFLVTAGDTTRFAERIRELLNNPTLRTRMGAAGKASASQFFDSTANLALLEAMYKKVISSRINRLAV
jgi:glycosyltransferase involved in cell wall biosynthesis